MLKLFSKQFRENLEVQTQQNLMKNPADVLKVLNNEIVFKIIVLKSEIRLDPLAPVLRTNETNILIISDQCHEFMNSSTRMIIPAVLFVIGYMEIKINVCPLFEIICGNFGLLVTLKPRVILSVVSPRLLLQLLCSQELLISILQMLYGNMSGRTSF